MFKFVLRCFSVLVLVFTMMIVIFFPFQFVKGQDIVLTPSQPLETNTQVERTATLTLVRTSTSSLTPSHTLTFTATEHLSFASPTGTMTPTLKPTVVLTENLPFGDYVDNEVLVSLKTGKPSDAFLKDLKGMNAEVKTEIAQLGVWVISVPVGSVPAFIANIKLSPDVTYAEPNYFMRIDNTIPNDGGWGLQYGPSAIRAPQGWDLSTGSNAVTIAVIDTGIDQVHPDLTAKIVPGYDFANNDSDPQDDNGHGTHVAGIAAASANNGLGIAGISWGARLMPVKVLNASGNGSYANAAAGIIWAADHGAQVINMSFGGTSPSATLNAAIVYAHNLGVTIVAAAGNSGSNSLLYPARYPEVIAVAATDSSNIRAGFSNYGPEMSVSAPGVSIYSSLPGGTYGYLSGTSMAAPMVSGAAAVLAGLPGNNNPAAITWELQTSALDLGVPGFDSFYGYGLIQLDGAIRLAMPITSTPTPTAISSLTPISTLTLTPIPAKTKIITATATPTVIIPSLTAMKSQAPIIGRAASMTPRPQIIFNPISTVTPTATRSESAPGALTMTVTDALSVWFTLTVSPTPPQHLPENENGEIQAQTDGAGDWLLPCSGILFILAGVLLAYIALRLRHQE